MTPPPPQADGSRLDDAKLASGPACLFVCVHVTEAVFCVSVCGRHGVDVNVHVFVCVCVFMEIINKSGPQCLCNRQREGERVENEGLHIQYICVFDGSVFQCAKCSRSWRGFIVCDELLLFQQDNLAFWWRLLQQHKEPKTRSCSLHLTSQIYLHGTWNYGWYNSCSRERRQPVRRDMGTWPVSPFSEV